MTAVNYARAERQALADLLAELGPQAPTLCAGWTTRDLAAHLVVRERRADAAPGILLPPLQGWLDRVQSSVAAQPYPKLVEQVRTPPWWSFSAWDAADRAANTVEFFVHHEDVRRAQPGWQPRQLGAAFEADLWGRTGGLAKMHLRRLPLTVTLHAPGFGELSAGAGGPAARVTGPPSELVMYLWGRRDTARVELTGPDGGPLASLKDLLR